jgi:cytidylate kinase
MRNWELARAQRTAIPTQRASAVEDFITISRAVGSGGASVAALLGERLGWPVFDRQILQAMAGDDEVRRRLYEFMDERDLSWFEEAVQFVMTDTYARNDYFRKLCDTILSIARQGPAIFLGRAADLILPKDTGLRVRIIAPMERRIQNVSERHHLKPDEARKRIAQTERDRSEFIQHHFRVGAEEQTRHDMIIKLDGWSESDAVELILHAMRLRTKMEYAGAVR